MFLICSYFFLIFFHNTVMIYNTGNRSNDITESQKEKDLFQCSFSVRSVKNHGTKITFISVLSV